MNRLSSFLALGTVLLSACATPRGDRNVEELSPREVLDFAALYAENCSACHGENGRGGASIALADPVYLALVDDQSLRHVIANGVPATAMPAFAESAGGLLTNQQIEVISQQIRARWSKPGILDGTNSPSYSAKSAGDPERGQSAWETYCESCHGPDGRGGQKGSAIINDSFLALVSDQGLRTMIIVGRPDLGAPDWRGNVPGKPMSDQEVTDVVAWLASHRVETPGQPISAARSSPH